jgi:elongation factor P
MISATQIRAGIIIIYNKEPHYVVGFRFTVTGRGSNSVQAKLKNLLSGSQYEIRFRSDDKVEEIEINEETYEYLYQDGEEYWFMHTKTFEQISLRLDDVEGVIGYLVPNSQCRMQIYNERPIGITPPASVTLKVVETEPVIKGATASGKENKTAKLETGLTIQVPMFIQQEDLVNINTQSGEYQGRPGRL